MLKSTQQDLQDRLDEISQLHDKLQSQASELETYSHLLEERVLQRTRELDEANMDAIYMLAVACEARDHDTGQHVRRIQRYSEELALELGLGESEARRIGYSAILHDVGKMQVPDRILNKPGSLTQREREEVQLHTTVGERILSTKPFFSLARKIARHHHENWDGSGYPDGLAGEAIPPAARIVRLVDVFDGLTSKRVYKAAWDVDSAMQEIRAGSGSLFDPSIVAAFERLYTARRFNGIRADL